MPKIFITCAVTGNHTTRDQHPGLPVTPNEIAESSLEAAEAGAAAVHIHVRDPETGAPSMELALYEAVMQQIRRHDPGLIINLTTGPGGRFQPGEIDPAVAGPRTNLLPPEKRVEHIATLRPDIATLDLNTMVFGQEVVINTPGNLRRMAKVFREAGVRPEIELFDTGDIMLLKDLITDETIEPAPLASLVMGVKYGFAPTIEMMLLARDLLPEGTIWTGFGTGRYAFPLLAQAVLAGGNLRVGLEDAIYIARGELAPSNAALVTKARRIAEDLGATIASTREAREILGLAHAKAAAAT